MNETEQILEQRRQLGSEVAGALTDSLDRPRSWAAELSPLTNICVPRVKLRSDGGDVLTLYHSWGDPPDKLTIDGEFPRDSFGDELYSAGKPYGHKGPWMSIKMSSNRGARAVAQAIVRRLLPEYREQLAKVRDVLVALEQNIQSGRNRLAAMTGALGVPMLTDKKRAMKFYCGGYQQAVRVEGEVLTDDVTMEIRTPHLWLALAIAQLCRRAMELEPPKNDD